MGVYDPVNTIDADTEQGVSRDDEKQEERLPVPDSMPFWPNLPHIVQNSKTTPTSPITPGGYYGWNTTIHSNSSRR